MKILCGIYLIIKSFCLSFQYYVSAASFLVFSLFQLIIYYFAKFVKYGILRTCQVSILVWSHEGCEFLEYLFRRN
jgi:hypothetical protein